MATGQTVNFKDFGQRIAQGPNYATQSAAIGGAVNQAIEEQRAREAEQRAREAEQREIEREARNKEIQDMQLAKIKQDQYESLNVPANTGIKSADQYINATSRRLVDDQNKLVQAYKSGDMDADEFAFRSAVIKNQVPALKNANQALTQWQQDYSKLLQEDKISKADNGEAARLWSAIQDGSIDIVPDEEGNLTMVGEDINVPLSAIDRIPKAIPKAPSMEELAQGPLANIGEAGWNDEAVHEFVDSMFEGKSTAESERMLKSIAVDNLRLPLEKAQEMLESEPMDGSSGATNALEEYVESAIYNRAYQDWSGQQRQQEINRLKLANEKLKQQEIQKKIDAPVKGEGDQRGLQHQKDYLERIDKAIKNGDVSRFNLQSGFEVTRNDDGTFVVYDPKSDKDVALDLSPEELNEYILTSYKSPYKRMKDTPVKRKSPFSRALNAITSTFMGK